MRSPRAPVPWPRHCSDPGSTRAAWPRRPALRRRTKEELASSWPAPDELLRAASIAAHSPPILPLLGSRLSYDTGHPELVVNPRAGDATTGRIPRYGSATIDAQVVCRSCRRCADADGQRAGAGRRSATGPRGWWPTGPARWTWRASTSGGRQRDRSRRLVGPPRRPQGIPNRDSSSSRWTRASTRRRART